MGRFQKASGLEAPESFLVAVLEGDDVPGVDPNELVFAGASTVRMIAMPQQLPREAGAYTVRRGARPGPVALGSADLGKTGRLHRAQAG